MDTNGIQCRPAWRGTSPRRYLDWNGDGRHRDFREPIQPNDEFLAAYRHDGGAISSNRPFQGLDGNGDHCMGGISDHKHRRKIQPIFKLVVGYPCYGLDSCGSLQWFRSMDG